MNLFLFILATGEPALCTGVAVLFALRNAIAAARNDIGRKEWFEFGKNKNFTFALAILPCTLVF